MRRRFEFIVRNPSIPRSTPPFAQTSSRVGADDPNDQVDEQPDDSDLDRETQHGKESRNQPAEDLDMILAQLGEIFHDHVYERCIEPEDSSLWTALV